MRSGILGFQPERLKQLRSASGLTQENLAELIICSPGNISKWEKGSAFPTAPSFQKLCAFFEVSESWLLEAPINSSSSNPSFFRSQVSTSKASWDAANARLDWLEEISYKLQESLEFPAVRIPAYSGDIRLLSDEEIEQLADECRKMWGIGYGPITDMLQTLENAGVVTAKCHLGHLKMDGVSRWSGVDDRPYVLIAEDKASPIRNRFDAAHELGHLVLHRHVNFDQVKTDYHLLEAQAHRFASAFLMPSESFPLEIKWPTLDGFLALKNRWKVSIAAMIKRCQDLEIVDSNSAIRLWKGRSARGWVKKEPLDDTFEFERPKILSRSLSILVENSILSKSSLQGILGIPREKLEELCGVEKGYFFNSGNAQVIDIRVRVNSQRASQFQSTKSTVLNFPKK